MKVMKWSDGTGLRGLNQYWRSLTNYSIIQTATCPACFQLKATHPPKGFSCDGQPAEHPLALRPAVRQRLRASRGRVMVRFR